MNKTPSLFFISLESSFAAKQMKSLLDDLSYPFSFFSLANPFPLKETTSKKMAICLISSLLEKKLFEKNYKSFLFKALQNKALPLFLLSYEESLPSLYQEKKMGIYVPLSLPLSRDFVKLKLNLWLKGEVENEFFSEGKSH